LDFASTVSGDLPRGVVGEPVVVGAQVDAVVEIGRAVVFDPVLFVM
jgi:hypothetical protein